jgi:hypothetical protein
MCDLSVATTSGRVDAANPSPLSGGQHCRTFWHTVFGLVYLGINIFSASRGLSTGAAEALAK